MQRKFAKEAEASQSEGSSAKAFTARTIWASKGSSSSPHYLMRFSRLCSGKTVLPLLSILLQMFLAMAMNCWTCQDFKELQEYQVKVKAKFQSCFKNKQTKPTQNSQSAKASEFLLSILFLSLLYGSQVSGTGSKSRVMLLAGFH